MNRIKQKLSSKDGVSILIALVGFMVAAMVSIVIVRAAVTAAERVANDTKETQSYLTLESAAQLVTTELEETEYTFKGYTGSGDSKRIDTGNDDKGNPKVTVTGTFASEMKLAVESVDSGSGNYVSADPAFTVALTSGTDDADAKKTVNVSYVMKSGEEKFDLTLTLKTDNPDDEIYLTADGYCTTEPDNNDEYHITWKVISVNRLSAPAPSPNGGSSS